MSTPTPSKQPSEQLGRVSTVDAIVEALRDRILSGLEAPGSPIREAEVCERYGVSRHSARTAMRVLAASGLLQFEANHGVRVTDLTANDVRDIYALRRVLESEAVSVIAAGEADTTVALEALQALESLPNTTDWATVRDRDLEFHRALVASLQRPRTTASFDRLIDEMRLAFRQLRPELEDVDLVIRQHRALYDAAVSGDQGTAVAAMVDHLTAAEHSICGVTGRE